MLLRSVPPSCRACCNQRDLKVLSEIRVILPKTTRLCVPPPRADRGNDLRQPRSSTTNFPSSCWATHESSTMARLRSSQSHRRVPPPDSTHSPEQIAKWQRTQPNKALCHRTSSVIASYLYTRRTEGTHAAPDPRVHVPCARPAGKRGSPQPHRTRALPALHLRRDAWSWEVRC